MSYQEFLVASRKDDINSVRRLSRCHLFLLTNQLISTVKTFEFENIHGIHNKYFHYIEIFNDSWNFTRTFNRTPLIYVASKGHLEVVKFLLTQRGIDID